MTLSLMGSMSLLPIQKCPRGTFMYTEMSPTYTEMSPGKNLARIICRKILPQNRSEDKLPPFLDLLVSRDTD